MSNLKATKKRIRACVTAIVLLVAMLVITTSALIASFVSVEDSIFEMGVVTVSYTHLTRRIIWELLDEANRRTGFDSSKGKLLIEAMPLLDGGCVLYLSLIHISSTRASL